MPVSVRGATSQWVTVRPGNFVLGDEDGVLVIPNEVLDTVLIQAERLTEKERLIRTELQQGLSLAEALAKYGHV
ncbi:hypothetical protein PQR46_18280 [Paraburkholderia sediminicola]|uniref:hypothetical protein n=1 Tax=Paraburkholderia sediminicola TaxID=458836 RepID=UPI0038B80E5F